MSKSIHIHTYMYIYLYDEIASVSYTCFNNVFTPYNKAILHQTCSITPLYQSLSCTRYNYDVVIHTDEVIDTELSRRWWLLAATKEGVPQG